MLAAGIAYGSLMVTDFRGFNQFGLIGGRAWCLCGSTMLLAPPLVPVKSGGSPGCSRRGRTCGGGRSQRSAAWQRRPWLAGCAWWRLCRRFSRYVKDPLEWIKTTCAVMRQRRSGCGAR